MVIARTESTYKYVDIELFIRTHSSRFLSVAVNMNDTASILYIIYISHKSLGILLENQFYFPMPTFNGLQD